MTDPGWKRSVLLAAAVTAAAWLPRAPWGVAAAQPAPSAATAPVESPEQSIQRDLGQQQETLTGPKSKPEQREQAAERLVSRNREDARQMLLAALQDSSSRTAQAAQIAVARALSGDLHPDTRFIEPLRQLLGRDPMATEAAVSALTAYGNNADVVQALIDFARDRGQPPRSRAIAVRGIGSFVTKTGAGFLVGLINDATEDAQVRSAAAEALGAMTGLPFHHAVPQWNNWWNATRGQADLNWELDQRRNKEARENQKLREFQRLGDHVRELLRNVYIQATEAQRPELLLSWLRDAEPSVRAAAPGLVQDFEVAAAKRVPAAVVEQMRTMIGDSSVEVRKAVINTLSVMNDAPSAGPLLAQLAVETDPDVKAAIIQTLAQLKEPRAVDVILPLLDDPSSRVAEAAANALRSLGPVIGQNPNTTAMVSAALRRKLDAVQNQPGSEDLRAALLEAMAPLHDPALLPIFRRAISSDNPGNSIKVRVAAAKGLGSMREPPYREQASSDLSDSLQHDPEGAVRLEAARALGNVATFAQAVLLYSRMSNPRDEPDASVRDEEWRVLSTLFSSQDVTADELMRSWVERFRPDPNGSKEKYRETLLHKLTVLEAARDKYLAAANNDPQAARSLALVQQNIGDAESNLEQWGSAAAAYGAAMTYWDSRPNPPRDITAQISTQLLTALLRDHKYPEAIQFAGSRAKNDQDSDMGIRIRTEVQRLRDAGDLKSALQLIDETAKMQPPLSGIVAEQLDQLKREIQQKLEEK